MTLPVSGPLSLQDIANEFGGTHPVSLSQYYAGGGLVPAGTTGINGPVPSSGPISIWNFYGVSHALTITYYGIGGGGSSGNDTSGGASGAGAVVGGLTMISGQTASIVVGAAGSKGYGIEGGTSSITYRTTVASAYGGFGNRGPSSPYATGPNIAGGTAAGGALNLQGGLGAGWNQGINGGNGDSGVYNSITYYAPGGGSGGDDFGFTGTGGSGGGDWAGNGGNGYRSGHGTNGGNYGGGGGGGGNYNGGSGVGAPGVFVITYVSSTQRATGGTVTSSGSGASTVWQHVFTSSGTFAVV